jgi:hypothetical protein
VLAGGPGRDTADFGDAGRSVEATVERAGDGGARRDPDVLSADIESATGGGEQDTFTGGPGANRLLGGEGEDFLDGRGGRDQLDAGGGPDAILARDGEPDTVSCGAGADFAAVDDLDRVADDCERLDEGGGPRRGGSVLAGRASGRPVLRLAEMTRTVPLREPVLVPLASSFDSRGGAIRLVLDVGAGRRREPVAASGRFTLRQRGRRRTVAELRLLPARFRGCTGTRVVRGLFARGRARMRIVGREASAATSGAGMRLQDRCDGTLVSVRRGSVRVEPRRGRAVRLGAGERLLVRRP